VIVITGADIIMDYRKLLRRYIKGDKGSAAVEFAMVVLPFMLIIFGTIETGFKSVQQTELDSNVYEIASRIATTYYSSSSADAFSRGKLCVEFSFTVLDCEQVKIGVTEVTGRMFDYRNKSVVGEWNLGCPESTLIVELNYPVTHFVHNFAVADIVDVNGDDYFRSRGIIRREPVISGGGTC